MTATTKSFKKYWSGPASALCGFIAGFFVATIVLGITLYFSGQYIEVMSILDSR